MEEELNKTILQLAKEFGQDLDEDFIEALTEQILYEFIPENMDNILEENE